MKNKLYIVQALIKFRWICITVNFFDVKVVSGLIRFNLATGNRCNMTICAISLTLHIDL